MSEPIGWLWRQATGAGPERARRWVRKAAGFPAAPGRRAVASRTGAVAGVELRTGPIRECALLSEAAMWSQHGPMIWRAHHFEGLPHFYPVYRCGDLYSYSLLSLILHKGSLRVNPRVAREVETRSYPYQSGSETIDRDIRRIGGPPAPQFRIHDSQEFARRIADAMRRDAAVVETANPGKTNVLLCGGRDSLNLLLLPWRNPVLVASAPPNHDLVRAFLDENDIPFDLAELDDADDSLLPAEVLLNACRNDLAHCRWGPDLVRIARSLGGRAVFWKGQLGDSLMQPKWREYWHGRDEIAGLASRLTRPLGGLGEYRLRRWLENSTLRQRRCFRAQWTRGAMWQGAHMSLLRQLTDALFVSIYHGPAMLQARELVDLRGAVPQDIRPLVGSHLRGGPVRYPAANPGPSLSAIRQGVSGVTRFLDAIRRLGIPVIGA